MVKIANSMIDRSLGTLLNEIKNTCCRISRKRPPRLSSQGGRVREEVAYESIDDIGSNVCFISMWALQRLDPCFRYFLHEESQFCENLVLFGTRIFFFRVDVSTLKISLNISLNISL